MVKCENCKTERPGKGPVLCPECGYIMFDKKPARPVFVHKETVNGDS